LKADTPNTKNGSDLYNCCRNSWHSDYRSRWYGSQPSLGRNWLTEVSAYAVYFDYRRRNDPLFRKELKRQSKRQARVAKEEAEANTVRQRQAITAAIEEAKEEGFPTDVEEREAYFMQEVARGEALSGEGTSNVRRVG
jgi:hypothetical protein